MVRSRLLEQSGKKVCGSRGGGGGGGVGGVTYDGQATCTHQGRAAMVLIASCHCNQDKLRLFGSAPPNAT